MRTDVTNTAEDLTREPILLHTVVKVMVPVVTVAIQATTMAGITEVIEEVIMATMAVTAAIMEDIEGTAVTAGTTHTIIPGIITLRTAPTITRDTIIPDTITRDTTILGITTPGRVTTHTDIGGFEA